MFDEFIIRKKTDIFFRKIRFFVYYLPLFSGLLLALGVLPVYFLNIR